MKSAQEQLQEIKLPLSETSYLKLQKLLNTEQIEWEELSTELMDAYSEFGEEARAAKWRKLIEEGIASEFD